MDKVRLGTLYKNEMRNLGLQFEIFHWHYGRWSLMKFFLTSRIHELGTFTCKCKVTLQSGTWDILRAALPEHHLVVRYPWLRMYYAQDNTHVSIIPSKTRKLPINVWEFSNEIQIPFVKTLRSLIAKSALLIGTWLLALDFRGENFLNMDNGRGGSNPTVEKVTFRCVV